MSKQAPLEQRRKPGLGHYKGSRLAWKLAWRRARRHARSGIDPDPRDKGIWWKATLIANYERHSYNDPLMTPLAARLECHQLINKILAERSHA